MTRYEYDILYYMKRTERFFIILLTAAALLLSAGCAADLKEETDAAPRETAAPVASAAPLPSEAPAETVAPDADTGPVPDGEEDGSSKSPATASELIYRMCTAYIRGDEQTLRSDLIAELAEIDPLSALKWERILGYFDEARTQEIHYDVLPDGLTDSNELCIVVLGYQLTSSGSMKPELVDRLKVALNSCTKYPNARILLSGGNTAKRSTDTTEAGQMKRWLLSRGVDKDRILTDSRSISTAENAVHIIRMLDRIPEVREIALITSDYHMLRASVLIQGQAYLNMKSAEDVPVRIVANAACRRDRNDVSDTKIMISLLRLADDPELNRLIREEDFQKTSEEAGKE